MVEAPTWDLDVVCPGGPGGREFSRRRDGIRARLEGLKATIKGRRGLADDPEGWEALLVAAEQLRDDLDELSSFAYCSAAADSRSAAPRAAEADVDELGRTYQLMMVDVSSAIDAATEPMFAEFVARPGVVELAPWLNHVRAGKRLRLPPALELLKVSMDREGLTAWGRLYDQISGDLTAEVTTDGVTRRLGIAEITAMRAEPDPAVRRASHDAIGAAWTGVSGITAHTLTQITGARQQHFDRLGVDELAESLYDNRIERRTVDAMWAAARSARPALVRYLHHKASLLGKDELDWWDLDAPLATGRAEARWSWDEACTQIVEAFGGFHPELARFAEVALAERWIDALPREGRRPGGFCSGFPRSRQSRIYMTFTGSLDNATTLAHELGHAFHNRTLDGLTASRTKVTSALAETASTFAEAVFRDRVLAGATDPAFRAFMLDQQLQAAVAFLMDIPHRFAFERRLFVLRRTGLLEADVLSTESVNAQREAFGDALASWNPTFWSSKLHFYIPEFGFYNWPYAFGYLFSSAVHARAKAEGPAFLPAFQDLLRRTGWQGTEALARETLGVDLRSERFWEETVHPIEGLVDAFVESTS